MEIECVGSGTRGVMGRVFNGEIDETSILFFIYKGREREEKGFVKMYLCFVSFHDSSR